MSSLSFEALKGLKNLSKDELMNLTGLSKQEQSGSDNVLPMLAVFGAGLLTGLCAGMLLAPNSGEANRRKLVEQAEASRRKLGEQAEQAGEAGSELVERARKQVSPS